MPDNTQYEQLMMLYNQIKNGSDDIRKMLKNEKYNEIITYMKSREQLFKSTENILAYIQLNKDQQENVDKIVSEIREQELENIKTLTESMKHVESELKKAQKNEKIQQAYDFDETLKGSIVNYNE